MAKQGWISIHRQLQDHWLWHKKPFSPGHAWIDMLLMANHADNKFLLGNQLVEVKAGSFITSEQTLVTRWGWGSRHKVRNFLDLLQKDGMLTRKGDNKKTTITIENWAFYQNCLTTEGQQWDSNGTAMGQQRDTNNNDNNDNNDNKKKNIVQSEVNEVFEALWKLYPQKRGKGKVSDVKKREIFEVGFDEMSRAIKRYIEDLKKESWREPQNGSTFFNSGYVDYLDANYTIPNENKGVNSDGQYGENAGDSEPSPWGELSGITRC